MNQSLHERLNRLCDALGGPILSIDASTARASVATVGFQPGFIEELEPDAKALPSESLAACVAEIFAQRSQTPSDLAAFVVGLGPGSFTGLRVALALIKGLAYGAGVAVYGVSSLALLAARRPSAEFEIRIDAQQAEIYAAAYRTDRDGLPSTLLDDRLTTTEQWTHTLADSGLDRLPRLNETGLVPRALIGVILAESRLRRRDADNLEDLAPRYLKGSEAERALARKSDSAQNAKP